MSTIEQSIDVNVPVHTAYNQWTQFEEFPRFMEGVEEIRQYDDTRLHWVVDVAGVRREFDAEITEQRPDERIAWTSVSGPKHAGVVTFHRLDADHSRVTGDMRRFREFIESRGSETGAWRGEVERPQP